MGNALSFGLEEPADVIFSNAVFHWINMFVTKPFAGMEPEAKNDILKGAEALLRPRLYADGRWFVNYVRIQFRERKPA